MSLRGASFLSPLLPSIIFLFLPLSLCLPLSCSHLLSQIMLASSGIQTVQGQSRDMLGAMGCPSVCLWTCMSACACVCVCACVRERGVDVESLKLFSPCPDRSESVPSPFNPLTLHHTPAHKRNTFLRLLRTRRTTPCAA